MKIVCFVAVVVVAAVVVVVAVAVAVVVVVVVVGCWLLVVGCWLLVVGWLLFVGCWFLVVLNLNDCTFGRTPSHGLSQKTHPSNSQGIDNPCWEDRSPDDDPTSLVMRRCVQKCFYIQSSR